MDERELIVTDRLSKPENLLVNPACFLNFANSSGILAEITTKIEYLNTKRMDYEN